LSCFLYSFFHSAFPSVLLAVLFLSFLFIVSVFYDK
jgi:hypothetical protein